MCSKEAISWEHVPPKCIFPESKDLPAGVDYRKNLLTVPSCADHNLRKSGDDEYLLYALVANFDVNAAGLKQWVTKLRRSMKKRPSKMGIFRNLRPAIHRGAVTGMYDVDHERLVRQFELICRGIYFYKFGERWSHDIRVVLPFAFAYGSVKAYNYNQTMKEVTTAGRSFLANEKEIGDNPDVFYYQLRLKEDGPGFVFRLVFYGGIEIFALSDPELDMPKR